MDNDPVRLKNSLSGATALQETPDLPHAGDRKPLEVWGGVEYTCNRVDDTYFDQVELSGHSRRPEDVHAIAGLGIRTLRVGLLWERHEEEGDWRETDRLLACLREAEVAPIAGLVHHGSGPRHTSLLHPCFAPKLAGYAGDLAARYPWIEAYTPVNEPNTTARFSCRYGIWYPHERSEAAYLRALLNQTRATVLSMKAIREVRSDARLIQTEDAGRFWSTPELQATCDLMNERCWLPLDLLCGLVNERHALFRYLCNAGISEREVLWFRDHPCPPDVAGLNYYVTSDRYLDHRVDFYPRRNRSAEGRYADLEAVRVRPEGIGGFAAALMACSQRLGLPVALTEVHLGCHVDDQIRWAVEAWEGAKLACAEGADCRAITFWALLGSFFWNELVTRANGHYEPGVFDVGCGSPQPTELAEVVAALARGERVRHPALDEAGWWRRPERILYEAIEELQAV